MQRRLLERLDRLRPDATICPGQLARDCGSRLAIIRPALLELARAQQIALSQRGSPAAPDDLKGPFRVRRSKKEQA